MGNDLKGLIAKMNKPLKVDYNTNKGLITVFRLSQSDINSIIKKSKREGISNTSLFFELLITACFPSDKIKDGIKPKEPIFKPDDIKLIESKYLKEIILMFEADFEQGVLESIVLDANYQVLFVKQLKSSTYDFNFLKDLEPNFDIHPVAPSHLEKINKSVEKMGEYQAKLREEKKDREEQTIELLKKSERHNNQIRGLVGETYQLIEKNNMDQAREHAADTKFTKNQNWAILLLTVIGVIVAILAYLKDGI